jgi:hypothetical protein
LVFRSVKVAVGGMASKAPTPSSGGVRDWRVMEAREEQPAKAEGSIAVMEGGRVMDERRVQPAKAEAPMVVTG